MSDNANKNLSPEERAEALSHYTDVPDNVRSLIWAAQQGYCPFCFAQTDRESHTIRAIKRGLTGDKLKVAIAELEALDAAQGINSETDHAVDCRMVLKLEAMVRAQEEAVKIKEPP